MGLETWSDREIANMIANYRRSGVDTGGVVCLSELLVEQLRRKKSQFDTVQLTRAILERATASPDGLTTYKELWSQFRPGEEWVGNKSQRIMADALSTVVAYCIRHDLPILTVLVVQSASRRLDDKAVANIFNDARSLGRETGCDMAAFIERETARAKSVVPAQLPHEPQADAA